MYRGTTPTLIFNVKSDLNFLTLSEVWVTIKGPAKEKTYTDEEMDIDIVGKRLILQLSQEDTLFFNAGKLSVQIRLRTSDGNAYASTIKQITLDQILKDGII